MYVLVLTIFLRVRKTQYIYIHKYTYGLATPFTNNCTVIAMLDKQIQSKNL